MDTINKSSYTKYAMYTALPLAGAAAGLAVPVKIKQQNTVVRLSKNIMSI